MRLALQYFDRECQAYACTDESGQVCRVQVYLTEWPDGMTSLAGREIDCVRLVPVVWKAVSAKLVED